MNVVQRLTEARARLVRDEWIQGSFFWPGRGPGSRDARCAVGAMDDAFDYRNDALTPTIDAPLAAEIEEACKFFMAAAGREYAGTATDAAIRFNDSLDPAAPFSANKARIIAVFDDAIRIAKFALPIAA